MASGRFVSARPPLPRGGCRPRVAGRRIRSRAPAVGRAPRSHCRRAATDTRFAERRPIPGSAAGRSGRVPAAR
eukprot:1047788-Lingulodinium_polyedra.AAC.1